VVGFSVTDRFTLQRSSKAFRIVTISSSIK
jgi:hypothetical protein